MERFSFAFDPAYIRILRVLGIGPERSWVELDPSLLRARFGPWRLQTAVKNIRCTEVTGPYTPIRAIGPHISLKDRGLSFGSNADLGVCIRFHEPVPGPSTMGMVKHPGLTVTVADAESLALAIERLRS